MDEFQKGLKMNAQAMCNRLSIEHDIPLAFVQGAHMLGSAMYMSVLEDRRPKKTVVTISAFVLGLGRIAEAFKLDELKVTRFLEELSEELIAQSERILDESEKLFKARREQSNPTQRPL